MTNTIAEYLDKASGAVLQSRRALVQAAHTQGAVMVGLGDTLVDAYPRQGGHVDIVRQLGGKTFAVVKVAHAGALSLGYCVAPVVVAFDQAIAGKVTIAAYTDGHLDAVALRAELNRLESHDTGVPQWGGPRNMCNSPQVPGGTRLSEAAILAAVKACLL